jgi:hypothetical protein
MLKGVHVAITGILVFYKRAEAFSQIYDRGGIPQETVTKETDILVVGYYRRNSIHGDKSNKRILAERYISQGSKIRIIREDDFLALLWGSPLVDQKTQPILSAISHCDNDFAGTDQHSGLVTGKNGCKHINWK